MRQFITRHSLILGVILVSGCIGPKLVGTFDGKTYISARQDYSVPIPQMGFVDRIGGDDEHGVTFRDDFGDRVSFCSLPFESGSPLTSVFQTEGLQPALNHILQKLYPDSITHYHPDIGGGIASCLFVTLAEETKTSAAAFIHSNHVYLVEVGLPKVRKTIDLSIINHDKRFSEQEVLRRQDEWLENRALTLVQTIQPK